MRNAECVYFEENFLNSLMQHKVRHDCDIMKHALKRVLYDGTTRGSLRLLRFDLLVKNDPCEEIS